MLDEPVAPVLRLRGAPTTWEQRVAIACLAVGGVSVPRSGKRRLPGVRVRAVQALEPCDVTVVDGIPTTSIARTLCDLGASVGDDDDVERALDDALRRGVSPPWIAETLERLDRPGPSGTARLRRVLAAPHRQGVVSGSSRERVTERLLDHPELTPLERQYEIRSPSGEVVARPDLAIVELQLGIEFHSDQWHYGPRRGGKDRRRDRRAGEVGWHLVYLNACDHRRPAETVRSVVEVVRARRALLGRTAPTGEPG